MAVELGKHQLKALGEMKNGCILKGGVGTGKSRTALAYYLFEVVEGSVKVNGQGSYGTMRRPRDIFICTTAKKRDKKEWEGEATSFGISTEPSLSIGGVRLKVISWNELPRYVDTKGAFWIFDEQRASGSGQWAKSFVKIAKQNEWVLLSATPGDRWEDYIPVFIANGFYKNRTQFFREHVVFKPYSKWPKVDHYVDIQRLQRNRHAIEINMPMDRHTTRHVKSVMVEYNAEQYERVVKDRWHIYEDRPLKDVGEMFVVMRKLVNSDPSRIGAIMELWEKHPKLIVWYNHDHELIALRAMADILHAPVAEWNGHKHQEIPKEDTWLYLVQYTAGAEGWNCVETDAMAFFSLNYSYRVTEQAKGRIDRMNTPFVDLYYYMLRSKAAIDSMIVRAQAHKQDFNEMKAMRELSKQMANA